MYIMSVLRCVILLYYIILLYTGHSLDNIETLRLKHTYTIHRLYICSYLLMNPLYYRQTIQYICKAIK